MTSAHLIDKEYGTIVSELAAQHHNIETFLLIRSAMLRIKYPDERKQHFWFELHYREEIEVDEKHAHIFRLVGKLSAYHGHSHFVLDVQSDLDTLLSIASDKDIEYISGDIFPL